NSALQRSRATMQERLPARHEWATAADAEDAERSLLESYLTAWEQHDPSQLVELLREDVRLAMPPHPTWYEGRGAVVAFHAKHPFGVDASSHVFVPTRANGHPAYGVYRGTGADATPFGIHVIETENGLITGLHWFLYPELFAAFGLPDRLA